MCNSAPVKRWHIGRQRDFAIGTEAAAGLPGGKVKCDQPRIVRAEKNSVGTGRLRSDCRIVPYRDAAADGVICRMQIGRQDRIKHPEFAPTCGLQGDDAVKWRAENELPGDEDRRHFQGTAGEGCTMPCRVTGMIGPGDP
jgi:hypothetical protein